MQSMTGFSRAQRVVGSSRVAWRLKSVNQRYLEVGLRVPEEQAETELPARRKLQENFHRGHVDAVLTLETEPNSERQMFLDESLLAALLKLENRLLEQDEGRSSMTMDCILRWPGMVREKRHAEGEAEEEATPLSQGILACLDEAISGLRQSRLAEGARLKELVEGLLGEMTALVAGIRQEMPRVKSHLENRLRERVQELPGQVVDAGRLAQELVYLLTRMDIDEELDRLTIHLKEMEKNLHSSTPVGRRLDFLCQELNREANTICSKSQDGVVSQLGVELKVIVEKLREQVQNLE
ncbi:MAG: YicC family protein [Magnetococcales bacterium]|nr:YicC family protein [Magnetococcales bacterium]